MDELIEKLALEAGFEVDADGICLDRVIYGEAPDQRAELRRFATLVAEEAAKLCDDMVLYTGYDCAAAIRERLKAVA